MIRSPIVGFCYKLSSSSRSYLAHDKYVPYSVILRYANDHIVDIEDREFGKKIAQNQDFFNHNYELDLSTTLKEIKETL